MQFTSMPKDSQICPLSSAGWGVGPHPEHQECASLTHGRIKAVHTCLGEHPCRTTEANKICSVFRRMGSFGNCM